MIEIVQGDITRLEVDAIVNAANTGLRGGGGVDGAIHRAAGPGLLAELKRYPGCATGDAVITGGHALPARYVIHAVGPVWYGGGRGEPDLLRRAYERSFALAASAGDPAAGGGPPVRSIAFPAISTGVYGYPKRAAAEIALAVMREHERAFQRVVACLYDAESRHVYEEVLAAA
ncbi:RNase III inhibitor [Gemmatimonadetes bacterium T265]|nr:RNase III inhibitor [Gemmatimonadetes bacterium T265]